MGTVAHAEGIVDVAVEAIDKAGSELGTVRRLSRAEPQVLHDLDAWQEGRQVRRHWIHRERSVNSPIRSTEVGAAHDGGTVLDEPAKGWQRGTDPEVIRNGPLSSLAGERHIEISSDVHLLPSDVAEVLEQG